MENIESVTEEKAPKQPFYSYRGVVKCLSAGISFVTDNLLFILKVFSPLLALSGVAGAVSMYCLNSMDPTMQICGSVSGVANAVIIAVMLAMLCRLFEQEALDKGFLGYNFMTLLKASRKQINKSFCLLLVLLSIILIGFLPSIIVCGMYLPDVASASTTGLLICGAVILINVFVAMLALFVPCIMVVPFMLMEKGNAFRNAWKGVKCGYRLWGKCFGLSLLLSVVVVPVAVLLAIPGGVMIGVQRAVDLSIAIGDSAVVPSAFYWFVPVVLFGSAFITAILELVYYSCVVYLYASAKYDEREKEKNAIDLTVVQAV